jgi:hypothetical protein
MLPTPNPPPGFPGELYGAQGATCRTHQPLKSPFQLFVDRRHTQLTYLNDTSSLRQPFGAQPLAYSFSLHGCLTKTTQCIHIFAVGLRSAFEGGRACYQNISTCGNALWRGFKVHATVYF